MAVMRDNFSAWPETVAFKRMLRTLVRSQQYVPPQQQPTGAFAPAALAGEQQLSEESGSVVVGDWVLTQNGEGDLVATHTSGADVIVARNPEGND